MLLLKTLFLLPHPFPNIEVEFSSFILQHQTVTTEILILKIEMLFEFQNKTNAEITGF